MASQKREPDTPLTERLLKEWYRFSFFKAVQILERLSPESMPLGKTLNPDQEAVRFSVRPGFSFPPSDIAELLQADDGGPAHMAVTFMGLVGPAGVLPYWYNELAIQRRQQKDFSLTSFFDIFHHRLISLFYLAWKKYQVPAHYRPGAQDRFSRYLLSLIGLGTNGLAGKTGLPAESLVFCGGLLSRQCPSAVALEAAVGSFTGTPVNVRQFIDRIVPIDREDQTRIGQVNARLGIDTVCGSQVWESQTKFQVDLGPMTYRRFTRFLPTGDLLGPTRALIRYMAGLEQEFDIGLRLKREEVPPCVLGWETPASPRLGWSTWIKAPAIVAAEDPSVIFQEADR